jgi:hypothetical protein
VEEKKKKRKKNNLTGRLTLKFQNNMEIDKILGGVSPLKKRQSSRGGAKAGKATSTASRRGGYAKSSGARGAGGRNVGGYNRHTRFQADKWTPPPSGGDIGPVASPSAPAATAPYSGGTTNYTFGGDTDNSTNSIIQNDNRQDNSKFVNKIDQNNNATTTGEVVNEVVKEETPSKEETPEKPKKGGFYEACHNADGSRKPVGSTGIDSNGKEWGCKWDRNWRPRKGSGGSKSKDNKGSSTETKTNTNSTVTQNNTATINATKTQACLAYRV